MADPLDVIAVGVVRLIEVARLRVGSAIRADGVDDDHVAVLADMIDDLPPVVVHRPSMQVVDGVHRLRAAYAQGRRHLPAVFVEGDEVDALVLAVRLNTRHGLPLTRRDRGLAVERLARLRPDWSDRRIASVVGVSHRTVAALRRRSAGDLPEPAARVGLDGRSRPRDPAAGRAHAAALLERQPDASSREIARSAGLSPATVLNLRRRRPGPAREAPEPADGGGDRHLPAAREVPAVTDDALAKRLEALRGDPSLRYSLAGRTLLRLLSMTMGLRSPDDLTTALPAHSRPAVAELARESASRWARIAELLETMEGRQGTS